VRPAQFLSLVLIGTIVATCVALDFVGLSGRGWWLLCAAPFVSFAVVLFQVIRIRPDAPLVPCEELAAPIAELKTHRDLVAAGFEPSGPPLTRERDMLAILVHPNEPIYAIVARTPMRTSFDLVSLLDTGSLQSTTHPRHGGAPVEFESWKQILPRASAADLLATHRSALAVLATRGLQPHRVDDFAVELAAASRRERERLRERPLRSAIELTLHAFGILSVQHGPLANQRQIRAELPRARVRP